MTTKKKYAEPEFYEQKLKKVMARLGAQTYNWDYNRTGAWVEFTYKNQLYRFDYGVEKAKANGQSLSYGSDCFAQVVLALEDLARIVDRGIYDLQNWIAGMKALPQHTSLPGFCAVLGFDHMPLSADEQMATMKHLSS